MTKNTCFKALIQQQLKLLLIPRSHSYCLYLPLCLEWYNGSTTPRVHSGVSKWIQCRLHYRPPSTIE